MLVLPFILSHNSRNTPAYNLCDIAQNLVDPTPFQITIESLPIILSFGVAPEPPGEMQLQTAYRRPQPARRHMNYISLPALTACQSLPCLQASHGSSDHCHYFLPLLPGDSLSVTRLHTSSAMLLVFDTFAQVLMNLNHTQ